MHAEYFENTYIMLARQSQTLFRVSVVQKSIIRQVASCGLFRLILIKYTNLREPTAAVAQKVDINMIHITSHAK